MTEPVIGLEIHAQLGTRTKIFCACPTDFGSRPNTHVCPVCLGLPGALPVLNRAAVDLAIRAALALNCTVHPRSVFARKNYFYPDLPKGYQISQYERPLATGGYVEHQGARVGITRVHLEEDAGKSLHEGFDDSPDRTYLDFNRSGVPLVEIVTEPDLRSAAEAAAFYERLRAILVAIRVNDGNMEEGSLRCDANVSVRRAGEATLGTRTEVKNLNSFRYLQKALEYEIERQSALLASGDRVIHETLLWDVTGGRTVAMRSKEETHDYRYFPEPDLLPLAIAPARIDAIRLALPELPDARRRRLVHEYDISDYDAGILTQSSALADYFERTARAGGDARAASHWILGEVLRTVKDHQVDIVGLPVEPARLADLIRLVEQGTISGTVAKDVFARMYESGRTAREVVETEGLAQISDEAELVAIVRDVLRANPVPVGQYRAGREKTFGFLVGQVMKATRGQGNPQIIGELLKRELRGE